MMLRTIVGLAIGAVVLGAFNGGSASARATDEWYGSGVHAYFAGDYAQARTDLTRAIESGSKDPRCYYFRSMTLLKLGRRDDAIRDMKVGAVLETRDSDRFYPVNQSLQRVQGRARVMLQDYRRRARTGAFDALQAREAERYEQIRRNEDEVLRRRITVPLESLTPSGGLVTVERQPADAETPKVSETTSDESAREGGQKVKARTLAGVLFRSFGGNQVVNSGRDLGQAAMQAADEAGQLAPEFGGPGNAQMPSDDGFDFGTPEEDGAMPDDETVPDDGAALDDGGLFGTDTETVEEVMPEDDPPAGDQGNPFEDDPEETPLGSDDANASDSSNTPDDDAAASPTGNMDDEGDDENPFGDE